jgi:phosphoribosyl 1,2-cyclic phosphodiesterase
VKVRFCGVRGSTPAPGIDFVGIGGHTSCVAITPDGADRPRLVLDAGTGIRTVTPLLGGDAFRGTILLSHLHWDHVQGLPFFAAGDREDADVRLLLPDEGDEAEALLRRAMSPPHFPIGPEGLRGRWSFETIDDGDHDLEGLTVTAREIPHKGGRTFGYRVTDDGGSFAYLPDHLPAEDGRAHAAALELAHDVDVLVHDAQFVAEESTLAVLYGHATVDQAVALAAEAGARELVLFHHSPARTDEQMAHIRETWREATVRVTLATEGREMVP